MKKNISILCLLLLFVAAKYPAYGQKAGHTQDTQANEWYGFNCTTTYYVNLGTLTPTTAVQTVPSASYGGHTNNFDVSSSLFIRAAFTVVAAGESYCFRLNLQGSGYPSACEIMLLDAACGTANQNILADWYTGSYVGPGSQVTQCGCWVSSASDVGKTYYIQLSAGTSGTFIGANGFCTAYFSYVKNGYTCSGTETLVLPVELTKFTARPQNEKTKLEWTTASEKDNSRFEIERSTNGFEFTTIASVKGAGNSNIATNYSLYDYAPAVGLNYYRLKQVDHNGEYKYSQIISSAKDPIVNSFNPNPASEYVNFRFSSPSKANALIQVIDVAGRVVYEKQQEVFEGDQLINTELYGIENGAYYFKVSIDEMNYSYTTKLIKN